MNEQQQAIGTDEMVVTVEMGDGFEPGSRTAAALGELVAALHEEHGDDVAGYQKVEPLRSFSFMTAPTSERSFYEGWPAKWKVSSFDGKGNDQ